MCTVNHFVQAVCWHAAKGWQLLIVAHSEFTINIRLLSRSALLIGFKFKFSPPRQIINGFRLVACGPSAALLGCGPRNYFLRPVFLSTIKYRTSTPPVAVYRVGVLHYTCGAYAAPFCFYICGISGFVTFTSPVTPRKILLYCYVPDIHV